ncbi:MAG TPA: ATP-binding protein [Verrucomicrobiae bacterium]|jgi:signal transduction histidine kinase|nr:ATP-binding protein [Verrucomicrobiae bacterium]
MTSRIRTFGIAVIATGLAWLVDILLQEKFAESSVSLYVAAALISAWVGGWGPALLSVGLTIALNLIFLNHPYLSMAVGVHGFERLSLFVGVALVMSGLAAQIRHNQHELHELNCELEKKVEKRTAALNESNQQLQAFCYTLAHDLRAPLRAIQGFADILVSDHGAALNDEARLGVERIRNSAERMGRLILDLLAYTDLGRADFQKQPVDLEMVLRNVLRMFTDEIRRTGADISVDLAAKRILADRVGVERVLVNLLANALKFSDPSRPLRIQIKSERKPPYVRISVTDNGIGIDLKYRERIFGVFERLSPGGSPGGTGIGLAIVKRSVEKMGGGVGVESFPGRGSCFWFELSEAAPVEAPTREVALSPPKSLQSVN